MTIIDWMFAHPWMTFLILMAFANSVKEWINININIDRSKKDE